jgi:structural maintenance of chromosome 1
MEPFNVHLLYDVLKFDPPEIEKAILFITDNVLIANTQEDAMRVAFEMEESHAVVALDGTFYQKSGLISGGSRLVLP